VPAAVGATESGFTLELETPAYGVAPGQAAVLYDEGAVVGAGTILTLPTETLGEVSAFETEGR
jgi:tRNA U34 2-thiouridine synthase MnmA/TrmU